MPKTVALVGASGTVGLELSKRLVERGDLVVKQLDGRSSARSLGPQLVDVDVAVLCLPDSAASAFVAAAPPDLRILDASAAHRTETGWTYGLPELGGGQAQAIRVSSRVANPGCYATGAILLLRPLTLGRQDAGSLQVAITAVGGYSTGGRNMLSSMQEDPFGYRLYGLDQAHRHIREIRRHACLQEEPIFMPAVAGHVRGTMVQIPFTREHLGLTYEQVLHRLQAAYQGKPRVQVSSEPPGRFLDGAALAGRDDVAIHVLTDASQSRFVLTAQYDNLGKGAAGAAEQNLELMLGLEQKGLHA